MVLLSKGNILRLVPIGPPCKDKTKRRVDPSLRLLSAIVVLSDRIFSPWSKCCWLAGIPGEWTVGCKNFECKNVIVMNGRFNRLTFNALYLTLHRTDVVGGRHGDVESGARQCFDSQRYGRAFPIGYQVVVGTRLGVWSPFLFARHTHPLEWDSLGSSGIICTA